MFSKASFFDKAKQILDNRWRAIKKPSEIEDFGIEIPSDIHQAIRSSVNLRTKSYRYVLPAQILAKMTDSLLDCRCVQEGSGREGSFDARSFCRKTIVEFDRENDNVNRVSLEQVQDLLGKFLHQRTGGVKSHDAEQVAETSRREFSTGQNIYVCEYESFLNSVPVLFQERGRRRMLQFVGRQLDEHADLLHRQVWRDLLCSI